MIRLVIASLLLAGLLTTSNAVGGKKVDPKKEELKKGESQKEKKPNDSVPKGPQPGEVDVLFLNGSNVRMNVHAQKLEIATLYGKLTVPLRDVRAIEFGVHFPEGYPEKIELALKNLNNGSYRERENASKTLIELGPFSYAGAVEMSRAKDLETSRRAKEIIKKLQATHHKKDLKIAIEDKVITPTFTISGRILTPSIKAKTEYFGEVVLGLAKMRTLRAIAADGFETEASVDAARFANAGQWLDTKFHLNGQTAVVITAKGLVDTWPQGPGQYMSGPNGAQGAFQGGGMVLGRRKIAGPIFGQMYGGILFGKIGESGEPFIIGDRFDGTLEDEGNLFLHIGPSPWNCQSTGSYEVKINRKE